MSAWISSILVLAAFALSGGGLWLIAKGRERKKGVLMLTASAVAIGNVLIWSL